MLIFKILGIIYKLNWYPTKAQSHKAVPTWNYQAVHITGSVDILTETATLIEILTKQTADFEASQPIPWSLDDAPETYIHAMSKAIVGIRLNITDIQAQFKLSQNKSDAVRQGVINGLQGLGTLEAEHMAELIKGQDNLKLTEGLIVNIIVRYNRLKVSYRKSYSWILSPIQQRLQS